MNGGSITFGTVESARDVREILDLQAANLASVLTSETMARDGFVTVRHEPSVLQRMNDIAPAVVARADGRVVGYALMMPRSFSDDVPVLRPLFERLAMLSWQGRPLAGNPRWFVMGQICIATGYRGIGIFDGLYRTMGETYGREFDLTLTEVAARNARSLRAHARVGFQTLDVYPDPATGDHWHVIALPLAGATRTAQLFYRRAQL